MNTKKLIGGILGIAIAIAFSLITPPEGLTPVAMRAFGLLMGALVWMVIGVMQEYITLLLLCTAWVITGCVPFDFSFASFSAPTLWLLMMALVLGAAVAHCGLLKRLSLSVMRLFPGSLKGMMFGVTAAGVVVSPLIPSGTARLAVAGPIVKDMSEQMGYENQSKGATAMFTALYTGFNCTSCVFLSASFLGYTVLNYLPKEIRGDVTWMFWFLTALPWSVVMLIGTTALCYFYYNPRDGRTLDKNFIMERIKCLGAWTKNEKITMAILTLCLAFWMTEKLHGISAAIISILAVCLLLIFRVMGEAEFRSKVAWDIIIFIGCMNQVGAVLGKLGINAWIGGKLGPLLIPLMSNTFLFVLALCLIVFLTRIIVCSWVAVMTIYSVLLVPLAMQIGMHPFIPAFITYCCVNMFVVKWQNLPYISSLAVVGNMVDHNKNCIPYGIFYCVTCIIGFLVSIPFWKMSGLIP